MNQIDIATKLAHASRAIDSRAAAHRRIAPRLVEFCEPADSCIKRRQIAARRSQFALEARHAGEVRGNRGQVGVVQAVIEPGFERGVPSPLRLQREEGPTQGFEGGVLFLPHRPRRQAGSIDCAQLLPRRAEQIDHLDVVLLLFGVRRQIRVAALGVQPAPDALSSTVVASASLKEESFGTYSSWWVSS